MYQLVHIAERALLYHRELIIAVLVVVENTQEAATGDLRWYMSVAVQQQ